MRELGITYTRSERAIIARRQQLKAEHEQRLHLLLIGTPYPALIALRHHVTGAVERGEAEPIQEVRA